MAIFLVARTCDFQAMLFCKPEWGEALCNDRKKNLNLLTVQ